MSLQKNIGRDPYLFDDVDVLANIPGIRDARELELFEDAIADTAIFEIEHFLHHQEINFRLWRKIHKTLFKEVYLWAGDIRTVGLSKGGSGFASPTYIEQNAEDIFSALAHESFLEGLDPFSLAERLAYYYNELNALHPFREGNGRSLKVLITEIARRAGYDIDWGRITRSENQEASIAGFYGDNRPFTNLFKRMIIIDKTSF